MAAHCLPLPTSSSGSPLPFPKVDYAHRIIENYSGIWRHNNCIQSHNDSLPILSIRPRSPSFKVTGFTLIGWKAGRFVEEGGGHFGWQQEWQAPPERR